MSSALVMTPVSSTNISAIGYDEVAKELHVSFRNSGTYIYAGTDKKLYESFVSAESKGKFFNANVKPHYKLFRKLAITRV